MSNSIVNKGAGIFGQNMLEKSSIGAPFGWYETSYSFMTYKVILDLCISGLNWHAKGSRW